MKERVTQGDFRYGGTKQKKKKEKHSLIRGSEPSVLRNSECPTGRWSLAYTKTENISIGFLPLPNLLFFSNLTSGTPSFLYLELYSRRHGDASIAKVGLC